MARKVVAAVGGDVRGRRIAVLGLTFKPNTDDMREAPALSIVQALQDAGASVAAYDPEGMASARTMMENVTFGTGPYDIAAGADALVIVTEWDAFRALDFRRLKAVMRTPVLVDLRNVYRRAEVEKHGFAYADVGRSPQAAAGATAVAAE
jgi:UDPglucose 6-dehydrogenase